MFEKYGEFDSFKEINQKAQELLEVADAEGVRTLARENGIDPEDAEEYITGAEDRLCTVVMAAMGKLDLEEKDLEIGGILKDWTVYVREACIEDSALAAAVRKKGKKLAECMAALIRFSFENKVQVSDKIVDITKVTNHGKVEKMRKPLYMGVPSRADAKLIIRDYYMK